MRGLAFLFVLLADAALAQQGSLLAIEEQDPDGRLHSAVRATDVVDINSKLGIRIDKAALRARLARDYPELPAKEIETVQRIQALVRAGLEALPALRQSIADWSDPHKRAEAKKALDSVARATLPILREPGLGAEIDRRLNDHIAKIGPPSVTEQYAIVLDVASIYINRLTLEMDQRLASRGVYLQLGAWIQSGGKSSPLHLEGFDTLPEGEFHEVKRWQLAALLSPETQAQFQAAQKTASDINAGRTEAGSLLRDALPDALVAGVNKQLECIAQLDDPIGDLRDSANAALVQLRKAIDDTRSAVLAFRDHLRSLQARYAAVRPGGVAELASLYSGARRDIDDIERQWKALAGQFAALSKQLQGILATLAEKEKAAASAIQAKTKECQDGINEQVGRLRDMVNLLANGREVVTASLQFSDKVLRHDIGSLRERTELDLRRTGPREAGDIIIIRFGSSAPGRQTPLVEERHIRMYKILTYVDVAVSLIFADPHKDTGLTSRFQAAPSYSVLLKRGRRDWTLWNELLQPGIGLNIAALDFNRDGSLEVGVGLVLSMFRDYLQLGYGYNLNVDSGYWFLGLRFPLPGNTGVATKP